MPSPSEYTTEELLEIVGVDCDWAASELRDRIAKLEAELTRAREKGGDDVK